MMTRLDRLARSTRDLLNILDTIAKAGAGFKSLTDTWADTTTAHGRLMLTVLGGLAEFQRELILARTGQRIFALERGDRLNRMGAPDGSDAGLGQPEILEQRAHVCDPSELRGPVDRAPAVALDPILKALPSS
jgi:hypothetical protein